MHVHLQSDAVLLRAERLGRCVPGKILVAGATFDVRGGETLAIVGPSGSGKTSLLRLLNRLDEPTSGTVFLSGADYRQLVTRDLRRRVGMVTQRPYLFSGTVAENLRFGPRQPGEERTAGWSDRRIALWSRSRRIRRAERRHPFSGEAQRVSFARILANAPEVLLLDEPTSALDAEAKAEVEGLMQQIVRERGLTCVLVTHDLAQAAKLAKRALMLDSGQIVRDGPPEEVTGA